MTKTSEFIFVCADFKDGKITKKQLILSINKKFRSSFFLGCYSSRTLKNPYSKKENGYNIYRFFLFEYGRKFKNYFENKLF